MRRAARDEGGQAIVVLALTMTVLVAFVGLAIDTGQLFNGRRTAQEAADSAAFAGGVALYQNATHDQAVAAATADATLNGYATDVPVAGTTVQVNHPPTESVAFGANNLCVEVIITTTVRTALMPDVADLTTVRARAVGCSVSNNTGYAVMSLAQGCEEADAIAVKAQGSITVNGGGIQINSCNAGAGDNDGTITMEAGYFTDVVGGVAGSTNPWPNLRIGADVQADPFAGTPEPSLTGRSTYTPTCTTSAATVNQPGIYTAPFNANCNYVLAPGEYIFKGGGVSMIGNSTICTGLTCTVPTAIGGVFLFFTHSLYPDAPGTCATVSFVGNGSATLTARTEGPYKGMLIWMDDACAGGMSVGGNGAVFSISGSIYVPSGTVSGNGNPASLAVTQIVSKKLDMQNANFTFNYDAGVAFVGNVPALVE